MKEIKQQNATMNFEFFKIKGLLFQQIAGYNMTDIQLITLVTFFTLLAYNAYLCFGTLSAKYKETQSGWMINLFGSLYTFLTTAVFLVFIFVMKTVFASNAFLSLIMLAANLATWLWIALSLKNTSFVHLKDQKNNNPPSEEEFSPNF